jgi:hypothetical protein
MRLLSAIQEEAFGTVRRRLRDVRRLTETRASLALWWIGRQEVPMTQSAVSFMLGAIAPVALIGWLIFLS